MTERPSTDTTFGPYDFTVPKGEEHIAPVYRALSQLREFADETARKVHREVRPRSYPAAMLWGALDAASSSTRAAQVLSMHGLAEQGMAHVRNVCEWSIRAGYIVVSREMGHALARRWFAFQQFSQLRYAMAARKVSAGDDPERLACRVAHLERRCRRLDALLCFPGREIWTKEPFFDPDSPRQTLNLFKMAKLAGQEWLYDVVYTPANDAVHAGPMALAVRMSGGNNDAARTLVAASLGLERLLSVADQFLGLGIGKEVDKLHDRMATAVRGLHS